MLELGQQWRALLCIEAPVAWFLDVAQLRMEEADAEVLAPIDPLFVEACEPGSIRVLSTQPDMYLPGTLGACVTDDNMVVVRRPQDAPRSLSVTLTLAGARRGAAARFPVFTKEQARRNESFWNQPFRPSAQAAAASE
jgi:hypothetical protein